MFQCFFLRTRVKATRSSLVLFSSNLSHAKKYRSYDSSSRISTKVFNRKDYWIPPEITSADDDKVEVKTFREDFQGTRVFVDGIPKSASWQDVKDHFRLIGEGKITLSLYNMKYAIIMIHRLI